jgi:hypothetical protein
LVAVAVVDVMVLLQHPVPVGYQTMVITAELVALLVAVVHLEVVVAVVAQQLSL